MAFRLPVDIGNRTCQHLGAQRITGTDFSEVSVQASEIGACYDNLRDAELRRNTWKTALRRCALRTVDLTTVTWTPPTYAAATTYGVGQIVVYSNEWWQSKVVSNVGNTPVGGSTYWGHYIGPDAPKTFDYTLKTSYFAGELVVIPATYAGGTTYAINSIVQYSNGTSYDYYVSLQSSNVGHTPSTATTYWQLLAAWLATNPAPTVPVVYTTGAAVYLALASGLGTVVATTPGTGNWLAVSGTIVTLQILYPISTGPAADTTTNNLYRLPRGFLRMAVTNPKGSASTWLGAPHRRVRDDWLLENGYIVTSDSGAIVIRFVGDIVDVQDMDPMFCEGLAARIAIETCERITQSTDKLAAVSSAYKRVMGEARIINGIETGAVDPPEDEYLTCRL